MKNKPLIIFAVAVAAIIIALVAVSALLPKTEPRILSDGVYQLTVPGSWRDDTAARKQEDGSVEYAFTSGDDEVGFTLYNIDLGTTIDLDKFGKSDCDLLYNQWTSLVDPTEAEVELVKTEYVKTEDTAKPFCSSFYRITFKASQAQLDAQNLNKYQSEMLKTYIYSDHMLMLQAIASGDGIGTSKNFSAVQDLLGSFIIL